MGPHTTTLNEAIRSICAAKVGAYAPIRTFNRQFLRMLTLGIETSGRAGSVAIVEGSQILGSVELAATGRRHARTLVPEIRDLFVRVDRKYVDLAGVAVSVGPGSFTGLRVGVVCAKTLCYALNCPVLAIDTFESIAVSSGEAEEIVWVIDDALRGEVFAGQYRVKSSTEAENLSSPCVMDAEDLKAKLSDHELLTGPGIAKLSPLFDECRLAVEETQQPMATTIALIGAQRVQAGCIDDVWKLTPKYLRKSYAEEKADAAGG